MPDHRLKARNQPLANIVVGRLRPAAAVVAAAVSIAVVMAGCASSGERGDREFDAGRYSSALDRYEMAMEKGDQDPTLYYHAAQAAVHIGDFSLAERYYSRALRYGGGEEIGRSLAEFYIATSNYTKAVRVLRQLLETTDEPQTIYNNLGAALMYGGAPLEAESHLLIAQQMDPDDPVPYVNLGVLYDKHMHQQRMALGFYRCYLKLGGRSSRQHKVKLRQKALQAKLGTELAEQFQVSCGQPYQPARAPSRGQLKQQVAEQGSPADTKEPPSTSGETPARAGSSAQPPADAEQASAATESTGRDALSSPNAAQTGGDGRSSAPPPTIYRGGPTDQQTTGQADAGRGRQSGPERAQKRAERAFADQRYAQVIAILEPLAFEEFSGRALSIYGQALAAQGPAKSAKRWLVAAVAEEPTPADVSALLGVYRSLGDQSKAKRLCRRFVGKRRFSESLTSCSTPPPRPQPEPTP